jgi:hypothetical protein
MNTTTTTEPDRGGLNPRDIWLTNQEYDVPCPAPRPPVHISETKGEAGTLTVTIQAGQGSIERIDVGTPAVITNASVSVVGGPADQARGFSYAPADSPTTVQFTVTALNRSRGAMVPFTVTDGCGAWQTSVGGGAGSF